MTGQGDLGKNTHVTVTGRVQGVGFRAWTAWEAEERQLSGWVRNRRDGSVEAVFSGPAEDVASMIEACRRGPTLARVTALQVSDWAGSVEAGFKVIRDA